MKRQDVAKFAVDRLRRDVGDEVLGVLRSHLEHDSPKVLSGLSLVLVSGGAWVMSHVPDDAVAGLGLHDLLSQAASALSGLRLSNRAWGEARRRRPER